MWFASSSCAFNLDGTYFSIDQMKRITQNSKRLKPSSSNPEKYFINNASNDIVNEFHNKFIGKIYSTPRLTNIDKQVQVLDEIADVYS